MGSTKDEIILYVQAKVMSVDERRLKRRPFSKVLPLGRSETIIIIKMTPVQRAYQELESVFLLIEG